MNENRIAIEEPALAEKSSDWNTEELVKQVSDDLAGSVPHSTVHQTVTELLAKYDAAPIRRYVPLVVRREARELLRSAVIKETEAKFTVPEPCVFWRLQTIGRLAGYLLSPARTKNVWDTYLDTKQRHILAGGYSCRRRETAEGIVMTLKSLDRPEGAIHRRQEWQVKLTGAQQPVEWPDSPVRDRVLKLIGRAPLQPLFDLRQTRIIRMVEQDGQPLAESSLDTVTVATVCGEYLFRELEVELLPFTPEEILVAIAASLHDEWNLSSEPRSKFERALTLLDTGVTSSTQGRPMLRAQMVQTVERAVTEPTR